MEGNFFFAHQFKFKYLIWCDHGNDVCIRFKSGTLFFQIIGDDHIQILLFQFFLEFVSIFCVSIEKPHKN